MESKQPSKGRNRSQHFVAKPITDPAELELVRKEHRKRREHARRDLVDQINQIPQRQLLNWIEELISRVSPEELRELHRAIGEELERIK